MWNKMISWGVLLLLLSPELQAARCKVDGKWYNYDSPQCSPHKTVDLSSQTTPEDPVRDEASDRQTANEAPVISPITTPALVSSYLRPWSEVSYLAEQHCKDNKSPPSGLDCLLREENGYWAMHGNFAMPEQIAMESKAICVAMTSSFRNQNLCMHNESMGYEKFAADSEMPDDMASDARRECQERFSSWSQRGSCMSSANSRFKYPNGRNRGRAAMLTSAVGFYTEPPSGYAKESEVVTFRVRPPNDRNVQTVRTVGEPPPVPKPITIRQRAARLAQGSADPAVLAIAIRKLETEADFNVLSAAVPQVEGIASLNFSWPGTVSALLGVWFTEQDDSSLKLVLDVEAGRVYLVDFVVRAFDPGSYVLTSGSNTHVFEDLGGAIQNVTTRLIVEETGRIGLSLKHQYGKGFTFHAVGVTSIEATGQFAPEAETPVVGRLPEQLDGS